MYVICKEISHTFETPSFFTIKCLTSEERSRVQTRFFTTDVRVCHTYVYPQFLRYC